MTFWLNPYWVEKLQSHWQIFLKDKFWNHRQTFLQDNFWNHITFQKRKSSRCCRKTFLHIITVVCILVRMKSFPRFWRNHPYCRNKWYLIWTGCLFSLRWSKKHCFSKKKIKIADSKNLIFHLRQFSIFFHENFMDPSLG